MVLRKHLLKKDNNKDKTIEFSFQLLIQLLKSYQSDLSISSQFMILSENNFLRESNNFQTAFYSPFTYLFSCKYFIKAA